MNPQRDLLPQEDVNVTGCIRCAYYKKTSIFLLCEHSASVYSVGESKAPHTCQHMRRSVGVCGPDHRLIKYG